MEKCAEESYKKQPGDRWLEFRGSVKQFENRNNGHLIMCIELVSEFDHFLINHTVRHGNPGGDCTSYLSSTICDELIKLKI